MLKIILCGTLVCGILSPALASDAAVIDMTTPIAVLGSLALAHHFGTSKLGRESNDADGLNITARASFRAPISGSLGLQADGQYGRYTYDVGLKRNYEQQSGLLAGHVFTKNANGLLGLFGQADIITENAVYAAGHNERYFLGVEGQYFFGPTTIYGQAAYQRYSVGYIAGRGDSEGLSAAGHVRRLLSPTLMVVIKVAYENLTGSDLSKGLDHFSWRVSGLAEYRLRDTPLNFFVAAHHRRSELTGAIAQGLKETDVRGVIGMRFNLALHSGRGDTWLDPMQPVRMITPPALAYLRQ